MAVSSPNASASGASKTFLLAAVALGILATVLAFVFIDSTAGQDRGPRTRIVVAIRDLRANATLDPEKDLRIDEIPQRYASLAAQSLNPAALANYRGQRINRRIEANQPVFLRDLSATAELELRPGERALTIPADPGIIIPGDLVKLIVSRPELPPAPPTPATTGGTPDPRITAPGRGNTQATIIGRGDGYRVLAVGGSLFKTRQQATAAEQFESAANSARTVTLAVTEADAAEIQSAVGAGPMRPALLLCIPADGTPATATRP